MTWSCPKCERRFEKGGRCPDDGTTLVQLAAQTDPLIGVELGGYTVKERLGKGGMGTVYRAFQHSVGRDVALKVIATHRTEDTLSAERFMREAHVAAKLSHPNVVTVLDFGQHDDGTLYLAMELVEGQTLSSLMREGPIEPQRAIRIGLQICAALEAMHARQIIHRDLKPSNVVLMHEPRDLAKVLDFGLARLQSDPRLTSSQQLVGSASYVSPEQARGEEPDGRADLYALGGVLYGLLEGEEPFGDGDFNQVLTRQLEGSLRPWTKAHPPSLEAFIERLLHLDPARRPATAADARERLTALLELDEAPPPAASEILPLETATTRSQRMPPRRRRRWPVALLGIGAAAAGLVFAAVRYGGGSTPGTVVSVDAGRSPVAAVEPVDAGQPAEVVVVVAPVPVPLDAGVKVRRPTRFENDGLAGKKE